MHNGHRRNQWPSWRGRYACTALLLLLLVSGGTAALGWLSPAQMPSWLALLFGIVTGIQCIRPLR